MLFHEIYGSYYRATASILRAAARGALTGQSLVGIVREQAFSESLQTIPDGLRGENWRLLRRDLSTPLERVPQMPLTTLQRRWLKALLLDPRIQLFAPDATGLEDVEPLFTPDVFVYYDRYADGDDYADPGYIARFRAILEAIRTGRGLYVCFDSARGSRLEIEVAPHYLEYSEKDDRFRLVASDERRGWIVNLSRITRCELRELAASAPPRAPATASVTFELEDRWNALERVLLHFSHLRKETERLSENHYRVTLHYDLLDETELVIRILSFGPVIKVTAPQSFIDLLRRRIRRQLRGGEEPAELNG